LKKIIIIEDDAGILDLVGIILQENGYAVIKINREITLKEIAGIGPQLIIIDFLIPNILGSDLCFAIKHSGHTRHIPVILFSVVNNLAEIAEKSCADAYLPKPFDLIDLTNLVDKLSL
jgi:DNA-binding response OmpR family regulator